MDDDINALHPSVKMDRETKHLLKKSADDRRVVWPSNDASKERVTWTKELAARALEVSRPRSEDD